MKKIEATWTPRPWLIGVVVVVLSLVAFARALDGEYIIDDHPLIGDNEVVHDLGNGRRWLAGHLWDTTFADSSLGHRSARYWRPLVQASYALDWHWNGNNTVGFHATNLLLHAATALLAWLTLRRWLGDGVAAFVGACFWALHPAKAENVAWISGRPDLLLGLGSLLALQGLAWRLRGRRLGLPTELVGLVVAFASKESALVLPAFAAVEWLVRTRALAMPRSIKEFVAAVLPSVVAVLLYLTCRTLYLPILDKPIDPRGVDKLLFPLESLARYLEIVVWPGDLSLYRSMVEAAPGRPFIVDRGYAALGFACLVVGTMTAWSTRRKAPEIGWGLALFLCALLPVLNFRLMPTLTLAPPRFLYLPSLGFAFALGAAFRLLPLGRVRAVGGALAAVCLFALLARSWTRSFDFSSETRFWAYEVEMNGASQGRTFFAERDLAAGRPRSALRVLSAALARPSANEIRFGRDPAIVSLAINALLTLTPDLDRKGLEDIAQFSRDLREGRPGTLDMPRLDVHFVFGHLKAKPYRLLVTEIEAASRLGDDTKVGDLIRQFLRSCNACGGIEEPLVFGAARAGEFELAEHALSDIKDMAAPYKRMLGERVRQARALRAAGATSGPEFAVLTTRYYSILRAWGRAYAAARPAMDHPESLDPGALEVLGELSFRAGDERLASDLLRRIETPAATAARFARLRLEMAWVDAPGSNDAALPAVLASAR